ncbi:MAG: hypothetical protein IKZ47_06830 [Clostridia bacterium]|nr:hypothetical protein [Clostridia bacterium]
MPKRITLKIAELNIEVEYSNEKISDLCRDYIARGTKPDIEVCFDREKCKQEDAKTGHGPLSAEFACIYRQIAEKLPRYHRAVMHGAVIAYKGKAYMFIAKSGTGKTTHIGLWKKYFEGVSVINGDKPIIAAGDNGIIAYGTPWAGKEMEQSNISAPLAGICLIKRSKNNSIRKLGSDEALNALFKQVYMPEDPESLRLTISLIDDIIKHVPFYELSCDISYEAAECSFNALTGDTL